MLKRNLGSSLTLWFQKAWWEEDMIKWRIEHSDCRVRSHYYSHLSLERCSHSVNGPKNPVQALGWLKVPVNRLFFSFKSFISYPIQSPITIRLLPEAGFCENGNYSPSPLPKQFLFMNTVMLSLQISNGQMNPSVNYHRFTLGLESVRTSSNLWVSNGRPTCCPHSRIFKIGHCLNKT